METQIPQKMQLEMVWGEGGVFCFNKGDSSPGSPILGPLGIPCSGLAGDG
jgi:hypothetical protein